MKLAFAMIVGLAQCGGYDPSPARPVEVQAPEAPQVEAFAVDEEWHTVTWTYDGDTVRLDNGERVRLINMNAPEIGYGGTPNQPCAYEAKGQMFAFGANPVRIERGEGTAVDPYGRTLAYLWASDGTFINTAIVQAGNAKVNIYPNQGNHAHDAELQAAEAVAIANNGCVWQQ